MMAIRMTRVMYHSALASLNESRAQAMALMAHELRREASIASDAGRAHKDSVRQAGVVSGMAF